MNDAKTYKRHREVTFVFSRGGNITKCADCGLDLYRARGKRIWRDDDGDEECHMTVRL